MNNTIAAIILTKNEEKYIGYTTREIVDMLPIEYELEATQEGSSSPWTNRYSTERRVYAAA